jgi:hypothetical protein
MRLLKCNNLQLAELILAALLNMAISMPEFSEKFLHSKGMCMLLELLASCHEDILVNAIRLLYTVIEFSENNTKKVLEEGNHKNEIIQQLERGNHKNEIIQLLERVISGPGICGVEYSIRCTYYAIITLKKFVLHAPEISFLISRKTLKIL